jgi:hypothetical protein
MEFEVEVTFNRHGPSRCPVERDQVLGAECGHAVIATPIHATLAHYLVASFTA